MKKKKVKSINYKRKDARFIEILHELLPFKKLFKFN